MTETTAEPQQPTTPEPQQPTTPEPHEPAQPAPTPTPATPTPASVNGDVPVETWRSSLDEIGAASSTERHARLSTLLDELDSQVSSL